MTSAAVGPWAWNPHPALWMAVTVVGVGVAVMHRLLMRNADHPLPWPRSRILRFVGALVVTVVAMGWPLGDLAAHWSLSALVLQRCVLVLAVASLLLAGIPDDVLAWASRPARVDSVLLRLLWPPAAVVVVTAVLVGSMLPPFVAAQSHSAAARALLALFVTTAGIILWLPVLGRVPGIPRPRPMIRAVYVVAQAVVPVFLSFIYILATRPLYPTVDGSTDAIGISPVADQQVSGFVSKLTFVLTLLSVAAAILVRAPDSDEDLGPEDPLVWADVQRHFERADRRGLVASESTDSSPDSPADGGTPGTGQPSLGSHGSHGTVGDVDQGRETDPTVE